MEDDKKKMMWMFVGLCVAVVGLMVYLVMTQFGGGTSSPAAENVVQTLPDGEALQMAGSKSEAFRGTVSTDAYFDMLGSEEMPVDEDVSLVSDSVHAARPVAAAPRPSGTAVEREIGRESCRERVFV